MTNGVWRSSKIVGGGVCAIMLNYTKLCSIKKRFINLQFKSNTFRCYATPGVHMIYKYRTEEIVQA